MVDSTLFDPVISAPSDPPPEGLSSFSLRISRLFIFDSEFYLANNPDLPSEMEVDESGIFPYPFNHYVAFGAAERRDPSGLFDTKYYLEQPGVTKALAGGEFDNDPLLHYIESGAEAGLDPNPLFDTDYYLEQNPDVAAAGINPLEHYIIYGASEGRSPSNDFDPNFYLSQYPDVAAAGVNPLEHFLIFGALEGRIATA